MINTYHGVGVNFGIATGITYVTGLFQTNDHGLTADTEIIRDGTGAEIEKTFYAYKMTGTFEYVATGNGPSGTVAVTYPAVGAMVSVNDTNYSNINATNWIIDSVDIKRSNVAAVRVTLKMTLYPSITV